MKTITLDNLDTALLENMARYETILIDNQYKIKRYMDGWRVRCKWFEIGSDFDWEEDNHLGELRYSADGAIEAVYEWVGK